LKVSEDALRCLFHIPVNSRRFVENLMAFGINHSVNQVEVEVLEKGIDFIKERLQLLQSDPTSSEQFRLIFGHAWSNDLLDKLLNDIRSGQMPLLEVLEESQLDALGAYTRISHQQFGRSKKIGLMGSDVNNFAFTSRE
jgi:hypothetical protein